jgi:hypothetical protein
MKSGIFLSLLLIAGVVLMAYGIMSRDSIGSLLRAIISRARRWIDLFGFGRRLL